MKTLTITYVDTMASSLPPFPPQTTLPSKHTRTNSPIDLPAHKRKKAPSIKPSNAFLFKGMHPLYSRHAIDTRHDMMEIRCTQPNCRDFEYKEVNRSLNSTNNYKAHYMKFHPGIGLNERDQMAKVEAKAARDIRAGAGVGFFEKPADQQTSVASSMNRTVRTAVITIPYGIVPYG
jgi:hypothetical protein